MAAMGVRRVVILIMVLVGAVVVVEARDGVCEQKCETECATNPNFSVCFSPCLTLCLKSPPTPHSPVAEADTDCGSKCARDCRDSLFHIVCIENCLEKCKPPSFFGCTLDCTNSKCAILESVDKRDVCVDSCFKTCSGNHSP